MTGQPDIAASAANAIAAHLSALTVEFRGAEVPLRARVGWPQKDTALDLSCGPIVTITPMRTERSTHPPSLVEGPGPPFLWRVADLTIEVQVDLFAPHAVVREHAARVIQHAWHSHIPYGTGVHLCHMGYHDLEFYSELGTGRDDTDPLSASEAEFRRIWQATIATGEYHETDTPAQAPMTLDLDVHA